MRFLRKSLIGVFLFSVTLALLAWAGQVVVSAVQERMARDTSALPVRERVFAVNVVEAVPGREVPVLEAFGEVQSRRTLELRAASAGRVIGLAPDFTEGGSATAGQLLVQIDPADAEAALARVQSDLADAEAEVRDADRALALARDEAAAAVDQADLRARALERQQDLETRGVGTAALVEAAELAAAQARQAVLSRRLAVAQAEARVDQSATRVDRARIALSDAERRLADTAITAAFDGTLSGVSLVEGRLVATNEKLAELVDPDALEVAFRVSTAQYARLLDADGALIPADVDISLGGGEAILRATGRVSRDSAGAGTVQTGRLIYATLDTARGFKPGDFVTVRVAEPALDDIVRLPAAALDAGGMVLVLGPDDRLEALAVTLVRRQGNDVLVKGESLAGREVVQARTPLLGAGIRVRPLRGPAAEAAPEPEMIELTEERRAKLIAFVEGNGFIPADAKARILDQLAQDKVPVGVLERLEARMGG